MQREITQLLKLPTDIKLSHLSHGWSLPQQVLVLRRMPFDNYGID